MIVDSVRAEQTENPSKVDLQAVEPKLIPYLPKPVQGGYEWFWTCYLEQFNDHVQAFSVACKRELEKQMELYRQKMHDIMHEDMRARVRELVVSEFSEKVELHEYAVPIIPNAFIVPIRKYRDNSGRDIEEQWLYQRLKDFKELVPPAALKRLRWLEENKGIFGAEYWVAEKQVIVTVPKPRPRLDPLLCLSFGRFFVSIADWK